MQRSTDAILTTHTGSLPRPDDLVELLYAAESGDGIDPAALHQRVRSAVAESVAQQLQTGIDIVDDGEFGKPGFVGCWSMPCFGRRGAKWSQRNRDECEVA